MRREHVDEVEAVIRRLQESGEYDQLATSDADAEADRLGNLIERAVELSDEEVELLLTSGHEAPAVSTEQLMREVHGAVERVLTELPEPSLLERLRGAYGISIRELVDVLIDRLQLDQRKRRKVRRYYEELEAGLLEPETVSRRVWQVLADCLRERVETLVSTPRLAGSRAVFSAARYSPRPPRRAVRRSRVTSAEPGSDQWDEVDELFRGGHA